MLADISNLSIWEIAHRFHNEDPNTTDPKALPLPVQDTLREITRLQYRHELPVCDSRGIQFKNQQSLVEWEHYVPPNEFYSEADCSSILSNEFTWPSSETTPEPPQCLKADGSKYTEDEVWNLYVEHCEKWLRKHNAAVHDFPECFEKRRYNRENLENVYLGPSDAQTYCEITERPLPEFWFSPEEIEEHQRKLQRSGLSDEADGIDIQGRRIRQSDVDAFWSRLAQKQKHRILCQEVAAELWKQDPKMTIAEIIRNPVMKNFGGGRYYTKEGTVRDWIKHLDPRPDDQRKGGRPANQ